MRRNTTEDPWKMAYKRLVDETLPKHEKAHGEDRVERARAVFQARTLFRANRWLVAGTWLLAVATIILAVSTAWD